MFGPVLKFAGSKSAVMFEILNRIPECKTLVEPFAGSAGVSIAAYQVGRAKQFVLSDGSTFLVDLHRALTWDYDDVLIALDLMHDDFKAAASDDLKSDLYYDLRDHLNGGDLTLVQRAAAMIVLNHTTYNGLWRVNSQGLFNAPWGRRKTLGGCRDKVVAVKKFYEHVTVPVTLGTDFEDFFETWLPLHSPCDTVVYCDPPYHGTFNQYTPERFSAQDQIRLANCCRDVAALGYAVVVSNSDHPFIRDIYAGSIIEVINGRTCVGQTGEERGLVTELVITVKGSQA